MNYFRIFMIILYSYQTFGIELQPHQKYTVDYLLKNPNQKGLLIDHSLGSGKTYLSLGFCENFQDKKVIVILPRFLKSSWATQMKSFEVKNPSRYKFFAFNEMEEIIKQDFSNSIVVIDEIHKLIDGIRFGSSLKSNLYSQLYEKIQTATKILALSGTPIYNDVADLAYIGNLISGETLFPLNPESFRVEYMKVNSAKALVRGHFFESKVFFMFNNIWAPITIMTAIGVTVGVPVALVAAAGATAIFPMVSTFFPAHKVAFRAFAPEKLQDFAKKYISFYEVEQNDNADYPNKKIQIVSTKYTEPQLHFFMDFADEALTPEQLKLMLRSREDKLSDAYVNLNSAAIQKHLMSENGIGRDIGNLILKDSKNQLVYPKKFYDILERIDKNQGKTMIYSNFFENGIMEFQKFLNDTKYKDTYIILHPDLPTEQQITLLDSYNKGEKKIIMIHPEITEGVSLLATEQVHILEPVKNLALMDQIIGRAVRFKSHESLPENRRFVNIFVWEVQLNYSNFIPNLESRVRREHWQMRFPEVNPNMWTKGIVELDPNYFRKEDTPDTITSSSNDFVKRDADSFGVLLKKYSIERL